MSDDLYVREMKSYVLQTSYPVQVKLNISESRKCKNKQRPLMEIADFKASSPSSDKGDNDESIDGNEKNEKNEKKEKKEKKEKDNNEQVVGNLVPHSSQWWYHTLQKEWMVGYVRTSLGFDAATSQVKVNCDIFGKSSLEFSRFPYPTVAHIRTKQKSERYVTLTHRRNFGICRVRRYVYN